MSLDDRLASLRTLDFVDATEVEAALTSVRRRRRRVPHRLPLVAAVVAAVVVVAGIVVSGLVTDDQGTTVMSGQPPDPEVLRRPVPGGWSDVIRDPNALVKRMTRSSPGYELEDREDVPTDWLDIVRVVLDPGEAPEYQAVWHIELAGAPATGPLREPGERIAYGLALDTTGDGVPNYVVGIDNDVPDGGSYRVWVTNVATGEVEENRGPRYGYPVEFSYPRDGGLPSGGPPTMVFTFLGDSAPPDLNAETVRFYAWASATRDGEAVATDYAPDKGWMTIDED